MAADLEAKTVRSEVATRVFVVFVAFALITALSALVVLGVQGYHRGQENHRLLNTVTDCTTPERACYQRGQDATAAAVGQLIQSSRQAAAAAVACAANLVHPTFPAVYKCVVKALDARGVSSEVSRSP